uniref:Uncharacterized protein n=1 Tax=Romanomermis culicivorax TaxID=13658 RepID=A0A915KGW6_ROMCU
MLDSPPPGLFLTPQNGHLSPNTPIVLESKNDQNPDVQRYYLDDKWIRVMKNPALVLGSSKGQTPTIILVPFNKAALNQQWMVSVGQSTKIEPVSYVEKFPDRNPVAPQTIVEKSTPPFYVTPTTPPNYVIFVPNLEPNTLAGIHASNSGPIEQWNFGFPNKNKYFVIRPHIPGGDQLVLQPRDGILQPGAELVLRPMTGTPLQDNQMFYSDNDTIRTAKSPYLVVTVINPQQANPKIALEEFKPQYPQQIWRLKRPGDANSVGISTVISAFTRGFDFPMPTPTTRKVVIQTGPLILRPTASTVITVEGPLMPNARIIVSPIDTPKPVLVRIVLIDAVPPTFAIRLNDNPNLSVSLSISGPPVADTNLFLQLTNPDQPGQKFALDGPYLIPAKLRKLVVGPMNDNWSPGPVVLLSTPVPKSKEAQWSVVLVDQPKTPISFSEMLNRMLTSFHYVDASFRETVPAIIRGNVSNKVEYTVIIQGHVGPNAKIVLSQIQPGQVPSTKWRIVLLPTNGKLSYVMIQPEGYDSIVLAPENGSLNPGTPLALTWKSIEPQTANQTFIIYNNFIKPANNPSVSMTISSPPTGSQTIRLSLEPIVPQSATQVKWLISPATDLNCRVSVPEILARLVESSTTITTPPAFNVHMEISFEPKSSPYNVENPASSIPVTIQWPPSTKGPYREEAKITYIFCRKTPPVLIYIYPDVVIILQSTQPGSQIETVPYRPTLQGTPWIIEMDMPPYFFIKQITPDNKEMVWMPKNGALLPGTPVVIAPKQPGPSAANQRFQFKGFNIVPANSPDVVIDMGEPTSISGVQRQCIILKKFDSKSKAPIWLLTPAEQPTNRASFPEILEILIQTGKQQLSSSTPVTIQWPVPFDHENGNIRRTPPVMIVASPKTVLYVPQAKPDMPVEVISINPQRENTTWTIEMFRPPYVLITLFRPGDNRLVLMPKNGELSPGTSIVISERQPNPLAANQLFRVVGDIIFPANSQDVAIQIAGPTSGSTKPGSLFLTKIDMKSKPFSWMLIPVEQPTNPASLLKIVEFLIQFGKGQPVSRQPVTISWPSSGELLPKEKTVKTPPIIIYVQGKMTLTVSKESPVSGTEVVVMLENSSRTPIQWTLVVVKPPYFAIVIFGSKENLALTPEHGSIKVGRKLIVVPLDNNPLAKNQLFIYKNGNLFPANNNECFFHRRTPTIIIYPTEKTILTVVDSSPSPGSRVVIVLKNPNQPPMQWTLIVIQPPYFAIVIFVNYGYLALTPENGLLQPGNKFTLQPLAVDPMQQKQLFVSKDGNIFPASNSNIVLIAPKHQPTQSQSVKLTMEIYVPNVPVEPWSCAPIDQPNNRLPITMIIEILIKYFPDAQRAVGPIIVPLPGPMPPVNAPSRVIVRSPPIIIFITSTTVLISPDSSSPGTSIAVVPYNPNGQPPSRWIIELVDSAYFMLRPMHNPNDIVLGPDSGSLNPGTPLVLIKKSNNPRQSHQLFTTKNGYIGLADSPDTVTIVVHQTRLILAVLNKKSPPDLWIIAPADQPTNQMTMARFIRIMIKMDVSKTTDGGVVVVPIPGLGPLPSRQTVVQSTPLLMTFTDTTIVTVQQGLSPGKSVIIQDRNKLTSPPMHWLLVVTKPPYFIIKVASSSSENYVLAPENGSLRPGANLVIVVFKQNPYDSDQMFVIKNGYTCAARNPNLVVTNANPDKGFPVNIILQELHPNSRPAKFSVAFPSSPTVRIDIAQMVTTLVKTAESAPPNSGTIIVNFPTIVPGIKRTIM